MALALRWFQACLAAEKHRILDQLAITNTLGINETTESGISHVQSVNSIFNERSVKIHQSYVPLCKYYKVL